jgi:isopentenyl-diphosphate delta-isomerase
MTSQRKKDHINLALNSQTSKALNDTRFSYEPMMSPHPDGVIEPIDFLGKTMKYPIWVSSMTGGTPEAEIINNNLAKACREFGLGMGLGSCRIWLDENKYPEQFKLRSVIGDDAPFYANLGIAQIEKALKNNGIDRIERMMEELEADGLFIHVNPLQEWLQPEGDRLEMKPIDAILEFAQSFNHKIIVKEVGQGMGIESLRELLYSDLDGIEFAAYGGTNFATLELKRGKAEEKELLEPLSFIGNTATEMLQSINDLVSEDVGFPLSS